MFKARGILGTWWSESLWITARYEQLTYLSFNCAKMSGYCMMCGWQRGFQAEGPLTHVRLPCVEMHTSETSMALCVSRWVCGKQESWRESCNHLVKEVCLRASLVFTLQAGVTQHTVVNGGIKGLVWRMDFMRENLETEKVHFIPQSLRSRDAAEPCHLHWLFFPYAKITDFFPYCTQDTFLCPSSCCLAEYSFYLRSVIPVVIGSWLSWRKSEFQSIAAPSLQNYTRLV